MNIEQQIQSLREELREHNYKYYVLDEPSISDYEFDTKLKELQKDFNPSIPFIQKLSQRARAEEIMDLQTHISWELNQEKVGKTYKVLFDRKEGDCFIGRTEFDSPDVDNEVLVKATDTYVRMGDFANVIIEKVDHFDLYGVVVD